MRSALALLALLALAAPAVAEVPRHTPGFPNVETPGWLDELLRLLGDPEVAELLTKLASGGPGAEEAIGELVERGLLSPEQGAGILEALDPSTGDLVGRLDPALLGELERLLGSGEVDPEELKRLLSTILALRESGLLDPYTFVAVARILSEAYGRLGLGVPAELSYGVLSSLGELLSARSAPGSGAEGEAWVPAGASLPRFPGLSAGLPSIPGLSGVLPMVLLPALAALVLALGIAYRGMLVRALLRLRASPGSVPPSREVLAGDDVVSVYWRSVGLVERVLGVRKPDYATHREYLASVTRASAERGAHGRLVECFGEITRLYEVVRFAGERAEGLAVRARERFGEMVRTLGRP